MSSYLIINHVSCTQALFSFCPLFISSILEIAADKLINNKYTYKVNKRDRFAKFHNLVTYCSPIIKQGIFHVNLRLLTKISDGKLQNLQMKCKLFEKPIICQWNAKKISQSRLDTFPSLPLLVFRISGQKKYESLGE